MVFSKKFSASVAVVAASYVALSSGRLLKGGGGQAKQQVCHVPEDDPFNFHTIEVSSNAASNHLDKHNDFAGPCDEHCDELCTDNNKCTIDYAGDTCESNGCILPFESRPAIVCDDNVECTNDSCDPATGCVFTPDNSKCDDSIECTIDECGPDGCSFTPDDSKCDDNVECTIDECGPEGCISTPDNSKCDDTIECTIDECGPEGCSFTPDDSKCDDNVECTIDECGPEGCISTPDNSKCDDSIECTIDECGPEGCSFTPDDSKCDDNVECTIDECGPEGCSHSPDDGLCDDGNDNTVDTCHVTDGCQHKSELVPFQMNTLHTALPSIQLDNSYTMKIDVKPLSYQSGWRNLVHVGSSNYERSPGIWFHSGSTRLHVSLSAQYNWNMYCNGVSNLPLNQVSTIEVVVKPTEFNVYVDGAFVCGRNNGGTITTYTTAKPVYVGDPWYYPADALYGNLEFIDQ